MEEPCLSKSRKFASINIEKFKSNIQSEHMLMLFDSADCQEAFSSLYSIFCKTYEDCSPLTCLTTTKLGYRTRMPWLIVALIFL